MFSPRVFTSPPLPYYSHALSAAGAAPGPGGGPVPEHLVPDPVVYGVTGFRIPSLPAMPTGYSQTPEMLVQQILYRFQRYLRELHVPGARRSFALQLMAHPEKATLGSQVGMYVLCRTAEATAESAAASAARSAQHAFSHFPREGLFAYGSPVWLNEKELKQALFMTEGAVTTDVVELRKHEDRQVWDRNGHTGFIRYVPHRFWPDTQMDPWLVLVENLAKVSHPCAIRIELVPVKLDEANGLDDLATAARWFGLIDEDLNRMVSRPDVDVKDKNTGAFREEGLRIESQAAMASAARIAYVRRGKHVFQRLLECSDQLFGIHVMIAAEGEVPEELVQSVRTALATPHPSIQEASLGWVRPEAVRPKPSQSDRAPALRHLNWMAQNRWAREDRGDNWYGPDLRSLVTAEEAASLFHLPIVEKAGKTSALSTAETPFVIPPEVLDSKRFGEKEPKVRVGFLYQRETLLSPANVGEQAQAFSVPLKRLMMPSLLVGAPGSGKTNTALYLLVQLWRDHKMPFLVLDPSTGQEFRLLLGSTMPEDPNAPVEDHHSTLQDDFITYTVGDQEGCPLRFNPLCVPPGVTVRSHITRLMAAFKSAYTMPDPFPAVFESALQRVYTNPRYLGEGNSWDLDEKGETRNHFPCLADFATAMNDELDEVVLPSYKGSGEATGILKGGTTIRIESLYKNLGHIINVRQNDPEFFQRMLRRPAVIELGGLGDTTNIALMMGFLLTQLVGHVEHAFNVMRDEEGKERLHLLMIEEAHRLLSGEGGDSARGKSAEDLSVMLAECRKFGQGIMILDQRPSSLVGGVLDNANVKILTRLHDRAGFERLAMELNLSEDQQKHARTRLAPGEAVMADWKSGQPVLIRSANVSDGLRAGRLDKEAEKERMLQNAVHWNLLSPPAEPYTLSKPGEAKLNGAAATASAGAGGPAGPVDKTLLHSRNWLRGEIEEMADAMLQLLEEARKNPVLYHQSAGKLTETPGAPQVDAALAAISTQMDVANRSEFNQLTEGLWRKMKLAMLGVVVEEQEHFGKVAGLSPKLRARRDRMSQLPAKQAVTPHPNGSGSPSPTAAGAKGAAKAEPTLVATPDGSGTDTP